MSDIGFPISRPEEPIEVDAGSLVPFQQAGLAQPADPQCDQLHAGAWCEDCGRAYGMAGFHDLVIPNEVFAKISTTGDENGLLCPSCLLARLELAGITCEGALRSGPVITALPEEVASLRARIHALETALEPFAAIPSSFFDAGHEREVAHYWVVNGSPIKSHFTREDLRRARSVLSEKQS